MRDRPAFDRLDPTGDIGRLLAAFAAALHRCAMYPGGHPSVAPAIDALAARAAEALASRPDLDVTVGKAQLVVDGKATDPAHPLLGSLVQRLQRHDVGAIALARGVDAVELAAVVQALATDPDRPDDRRAGALRVQWPHVRLQRIALDRLGLDPGVLDSAPSEATRPEPLRVVQMCLELDAVNDALARALDALPRGRHAAALLALADASPAGNAAAAAVLDRLRRPDIVRDLLETLPVDFRTLDRLLPHLGGDAIDAVFEAIATSQNRALRRALLDRLVRLGPEIARLAVGRLYDARWYVVRNMLLLIGEWPRLPEDFSAEPFLAHAHPQVRREALRILARDPHARQPAVTRVLATERDIGVLWVALASLRDECPAWALEPLRRLAEDRGVPAPLRAIAARLLAREQCVQTPGDARDATVRAGLLACGAR